MAHQKMEKSFLMKGGFFLYSTYVYVSTFWLPVFFFFWDSFMLLCISEMCSFLLPSSKPLYYGLWITKVFPIWTTKNKAAKNICVQIFLDMH